MKYCSGLFLRECVCGVNIWLCCTSKNNTFILPWEIEFWVGNNFFPRVMKSLLCSLHLQCYCWENQRHSDYFPYDLSPHPPGDFRPFVLSILVLMLVCFHPLSWGLDGSFQSGNSCLSALGIFLDFFDKLSSPPPSIISFWKFCLDIEPPEMFLQFSSLFSTIFHLFFWIYFLRDFLLFYLPILLLVPSPIPTPIKLFKSSSFNQCSFVQHAAALSSGWLYLLLFLCVYWWFLHYVFSLESLKFLEVSFFYCLLFPLRSSK